MGLFNAARIIKNAFKKTRTSSLYVFVEKRVVRLSHSRGGASQQGCGLIRLDRPFADDAINELDAMHGAFRYARGLRHRHRVHRLIALVQDVLARSLRVRMNEQVYTVRVLLLKTEGGILVQVDRLGRRIAETDLYAKEKEIRHENQSPGSQRTWRQDTGIVCGLCSDGIKICAQGSNLFAKILIKASPCYMKKGAVLTAPSLNLVHSGGSLR